jgi:hypothetical protein
MDKKDIIFIVTAFCVIFIIAVVLKPMITGKSVNTGIPGFSVPQQTSLGDKPNYSTVSSNVTQKITLVTTAPTPTPIPTWDKTVKTVEFVDPGSYGISMNQSLPGGTRINATLPNNNMILYESISGRYSGTTQVTHIPFPYWELWYTADPSVQMGGKDSLTAKALTEEKGSGISRSSLSGSYSITYPTLSIQVMDGDDPNREVRYVTPPGGLDSALWSGSMTASPAGRFMNMTAKYETFTSESVTKTDPRPWKEKFFEGQKSYYFIIVAHSLNSYNIEIRVPERYIGKY